MLACQECASDVDLPRLRPFGKRDLLRMTDRTINAGIIDEDIEWPELSCPGKKCSDVTGVSNVRDRSE